MPIPSPFHDRTAALCESHAWKDWAGNYAVCRYGHSHVPEYFAFREATGLLDVSALYKYEVTGRDAAALLSRVMVRGFTKMKPGRVAYTCWCDERGFLIDDGTVTRLAEDRFFVTAAEPSRVWFLRAARGLDVEVEDVTERTAALAVQGPTSRGLLAQASEAEVEALPFFGSTEGEIAGKPARVTRTGYTGDLGYEVWCDADDALAVWDAISDAGRDYGLLPAGLDALDVARVEAGFIMQGVDYYSSPHVTIDARRSTPTGAGLGWTVNLKREQRFIGRRALEREAESGSAWQTVGVEADWGELEELYASYGLPPALPASVERSAIPLYADGQYVGYTSSSVWSPILKRYIGIACVKTPWAATGTELSWEHTALYERRAVTARVTERPFFDPERKRGDA